MLDENFEIAEDVTSAYSESTLNALVSKMKRIDREDTDIISIPRLNSHELKDLVIAFLESLNDISLMKKIRELYINQEETFFNSIFEKEEEAIFAKWEQYKKEYLLGKAESFLNENNIDFNSCSIMDLNYEPSITIDLMDKKEEFDVKPAKNWWQFWKH